MRPKAFRSRTLKEIYHQAELQGFTGGVHRGSKHFFLRCPVKGCGFEQSLSTSMPEGSSRNVLNIISVLRRHGFVWEGRGGSHTDPLLNATLQKNREEAQCARD